MVISNPFNKITLFKMHKDFVRFLVFIDSQRFASGGDDGAIIIWDIKSHKPIYCLTEHSRPISALFAYSSSSINNNKNQNKSHRRLISSASDKKIIIWSVDTGEKLNEFAFFERMAKSFVMLDEEIKGELFLSAGEKLSLWSSEEGLLTVGKPNREEEIQYMILMKKVFILLAVEADIIIVKMKQENGEYSFDSHTTKLKQHREYIKSLQVVDDDTFASGSLDGMVVQWSLETGQQLCVFNYFLDYMGIKRMYLYKIQHMLVLARRFLLVGYGHSFSIFDTQFKNRSVNVDSAHMGDITYLQLVYEDLFLATCSEDATIKIWAIVPKKLPSEDSEQKITEDSEKNAALNLENAYNEADIGIDTFSNCLEMYSEIELILIGTCFAHTGSITNCLSIGPSEFVSCSNDNLVISWKDNLFDRLQMDANYFKQLSR